MASFAGLEPDLPPPPPSEDAPPSLPASAGSRDGPLHGDDSDVELMARAAAASSAAEGNSRMGARFSNASSDSGDEGAPLPPPPDDDEEEEPASVGVGAVAAAAAAAAGARSSLHTRRKSAFHVLQAESEQSFDELHSRMQKSALGGLSATAISSPVPKAEGAHAAALQPLILSPGTPMSPLGSGEQQAREANGSVSVASLSSPSATATPTPISRSVSSPTATGLPSPFPAAHSKTTPGTPLTSVLQRRGSDFRQRLNSVPLLASSIYSALSPGSASATATPGGQKKTCLLPGCVAFAARNGYCLRHVWKLTVEQLEPLNEQQYQVAKELVSTEKSYADSLRVIYKSFVLRLTMQQELDPLKSLLTAEEQGKIFHNVEDLYKLSESLYSDLEEITLEKVLTSAVGTTMLHYAPQFRIYQTYLENYDDAVRVLNQVRKEKPEFEFFCKLQEKCEGMSLESFLIMPVQRLPRYLLLLNELIKRSQSAAVAGTLPPGSLEDMIAAKDRIGSIANAINLSLHQKENQSKVAAIQACFERDSRYQDLVTPTRYLVREGALKKRYGKGSRHFASSTIYTFFLFNDILLYADASKNVIGKGVTYKLKHILPLADMVVQAKCNAKGKDKDILVSTRSGGSDKSFELSCADTAERDSWIREMQAAIDKLKEDNRNLKSTSFDGSDVAAGADRKSQKFKTMMGV